MRSRYSMLTIPPLPMRCHGKPITSASRCAGQRQGAFDTLGPNEPTGVEPPRSQPHGDPSMHKHLEAVGASVGEQVSVMRSSRAEHGYHSSQNCLRARAHVQGLDRQPHGLDSDQRRISRSQAALPMLPQNGPAR
jgi:hypothetical protein